jgi:hypothetical protein
MLGALDVPIEIVPLPLVFVSIESVPAPLEVRVKFALVPPGAIVRAPVAVRLVELPRLTVPEPDCKVKRPDDVDQVEAAPPVMVSDAPLVWNVDAPYAVILTAVLP